MSLQNTLCLQTVAQGQKTMNAREDYARAAEGNSTTEDTGDLGQLSGHGRSGLREGDVWARLHTAARPPASVKSKSTHEKSHADEEIPKKAKKKKGWKKPAVSRYFVLTYRHFTRSHQHPFSSSRATLPAGHAQEASIRL